MRKGKPPKLIVQENLFERGTARKIPAKKRRLISPLELEAEKLARKGVIPLTAKKGKLKIPRIVGEHLTELYKLGLNTKKLTGFLAQKKALKKDSYWNTAETLKEIARIQGIIRPTIKLNPVQRNQVRERLGIIIGLINRKIENEEIRGKFKKEKRDKSKDKKEFALQEKHLKDTVIEKPDIKKLLSGKEKIIKAGNILKVLSSLEQKIALGGYLEKNFTAEEKAALELLRRERNQIERHGMPPIEERQVIRGQRIRFNDILKMLKEKH